MQRRVLPVMKIVRTRGVLKRTKRLLRRDWWQMRKLRASMRGMQTLLFPENEMNGFVLRGKTGIHLKQQLQTRIDGSGLSAPLATDSDLERERELFDELPPQQLAQRATKLRRLADRIRLEKGDPANVANLLTLLLLSGWLQCKFIVHTSKNEEIIKEAQELEQLHYSRIRSLLRISMVKTLRPH